MNQPLLPSQSAHATCISVYSHRMWYQTVFFLTQNCLSDVARIEGNTKQFSVFADYQQFTHTPRYNVYLGGAEKPIVIWSSRHGNKGRRVRQGTVGTESSSLTKTYITAGGDALTRNVQDIRNMTHVVSRGTSGDLQRIDRSLVDHGVEVDRRVGRSWSSKLLHIGLWPMTYLVLMWLQSRISTTSTP